MKPIVTNPHGPVTFEDAPYGWVIIEMEDKTSHVMPTHDTRNHYASADCWCDPEEPELGCFEHNSADGREDFEMGIRKPS